MSNVKRYIQPSISFLSITALDIITLSINDSSGEMVALWSDGESING